MKKYNQLIKKLGIIIISIFLANTVAAKTTIKGANIQGLELLENIGKHKEKLRVYFTAKPTSGELKQLVELSKELAENIGIEFSTKLNTNDGNRLSWRNKNDPSASFEINSATGSFLFNSGMKRYRKEHHSDNLPSEREIVDLGFNVVKHYGLQVNIDEMKVSHVGGLNMGITNGTGKTEIFEKLKTVRFSRVLGKLPVEGDGRMIFHFGENSDLAGLIFQWPKIKSVKTLSSSLFQKPEDIAEKALKQLTEMGLKALRSKLTTVDLILYDDGQGVIEPAYHFVMERYFDNGVSEEPVMIPYDFYLPTSIKPLAVYPYMENTLIKPAEEKEKKYVSNSINE